MSCGGQTHRRWIGVVNLGGVGGLGKAAAELPHSLWLVCFYLGRD